MTDRSHRSAEDALVIRRARAVDFAPLGQLMVAVYAQLPGFPGRPSSRGTGAAPTATRR